MYKLFCNLQLQKLSQILCFTITFYEKDYQTLISLEFIKQKRE